MLLAHSSTRDSNKLPSDPRTIINQFNLNPHCSSFLQCPTCYALYPYNSTITSANSEFKKYTHGQTPTSPPCNAHLWEEHQVSGKTIHAPHWKHIYQSLKEWVGRLLTCPGLRNYYTNLAMNWWPQAWRIFGIHLFLGISGTLMGCPFFIIIPMNYALLLASTLMGSTCYITWKQNRPCCVLQYTWSSSTSPLPVMNTPPLA